MSRLFLATEASLNRQVVVKVLPPDITSQVSTERFRQEIEVAAHLQHPNILPVLTAGTRDNLLYYVIPFVPGESLRHRLTREGRLPVSDSLRILHEVADALAFAHAEGVIHRDIKPENILLEGSHAVLTDFGVARALGESRSGGRITDTGLSVGTPGYMAPEQAAGDRQVDGRADVYALAVVGYEMLVGSPPFEGSSAQALLAAHLTATPRPLLDLRPEAPPAAANAIARALAKDPNARLRTAAEFRDALAPAHSSGSGRRASRRLPGGIAAAMLLFLGGGAALLMRRDVPGSLDPNLLAVAPFDVLGSGLSVWREGLVDLLSRNLDGAGPIRTVSPSVVVTRWSGRADPSSAAELGRRSGAGLTVFGSLIGVGSDSFRLDAAILDVDRARILGEVRLRGHTGHMDQLADSLAVGLLRELSRTKDIVAVRTASLKAASVPALKAFLEGEQLYRRGSWDSAQGAYQRALALDSMLVPALRHLGLSISWRAVGNDDYVPYLLRAGELNHGLSRRDSLLVTADSLMAALTNPQTLPPASRRELSTRLFQTLSEGTRLYPEDPEMWYSLGEARMHFGSYILAAQAEVLDAFDRSISLDPSFSPAYAHATELGLALYGLPGWERYTRPYLALGPSDTYADHIRLLDAIIGDSTGAHSARADSLIRATGADRILDAMISVWHYPDSAETVIRLGRALVTAPAQSKGVARDLLARRLLLAAALGYRGHLRESLKVLGEEERISWIGASPAEIAMVAPTNAQAIDARLQRWLRRGPLWPPGEGVTGGAPGPLLWALPWWAGRGDTASLALFARRADSAQRVSTRPLRKEVEQYGVQSAAAYLALATGDTATALRRFQALPHDVFWGALDRVTEGRILAKLGRTEDALDLLDRAFNSAWVGPVFVLTNLERGALAEKLGQKKRALTAYHFVADAWRHADPELSAYVEQARQGLARLTSEPHP
jgi:serine/threonine-protein kinase